VSSKPLTHDDLPRPVGADDPLDELSDPYDLGDGPEEPGAFDDPEEYGDLAVADDPAVPGALAFGDSDPVVLVWPRDEYEEIDQRWPEVLEPIGVDSWDGYRRYYQAMITRWVSRDLPPLSLVTGTADGFAEWLAEQGADPLSVDLVAMADGYGDQLAEQGGAVELPPAADAPCWCGSGVSYQQCCRPLAP
jgi:hypothetical protein